MYQVYNAYDTWRVIIVSKLDNYDKTENIRTVLRRTAQCPSLDS